jgi:hypothetical protein
MESEMKKRNVFVAVLIVLALLAMPMVVLAADCGQGDCRNPSDPGANHGAFANDNGNFGFLGEVGGTPGYHNGAVGQDPGATGYNNSASAPWGAQNP